MHGLNYRLRDNREFKYVPEIIFDAILVLQELWVCGTISVPADQHLNCLRNLKDTKGRKGLSVSTSSTYRSNADTLCELIVGTNVFVDFVK
jgi:hypothetical protein